ncbi:MAG: hypothetical protein ACYS0G_14470 [Planctomycetota bacterium]|jgi:hypothetical protein
MRFKNSRTSPDRTRSSDLPALVVLNAVLLGLLAVVTFAPGADAQLRARGVYTMVAGGVSGSDSSAVYIVDSTNQELMVVTFNNSTKRLDGIGYRNLAVDAEELTRGRTRPGS